MVQQYYVTVCSRHKTHNDECVSCRNFDKACREKLSAYQTPPEQHPTVIAPRIREWMERVFPVIKS